MRVVIFGGNGFIGKHLVESLRKQKKNKIFVYGNKSYSVKGPNLIKYNESNFERIIKKNKPNVIFFLSGNSYPNNTINDDIYDFKSSNLVIQELLTALKKTSYKHLFFYTSSIAVYGSVNIKKSVNEKYLLNPESPYGISKLIAEKQIEYFSKKTKFKSIVLRLSSIYGPGLSRQIIYDIIKGIMVNDKMFLKGSIIDSRQFLYVKDCVKIFKYLINKKHEKFTIFNIASGKKIKIFKITNLIKNILKKKIEIKFLDKLKSPSLPALSNLKLIKKIGKINFTSFEIGLLETLDWIKKNNKKIK